MTTITFYWAVFLSLWFIALFVLVPYKRFLELLPVGLWMGIFLAIMIQWLGQTYFKLWYLPSDIQILGIPVFTVISWFPPTIIYAAFFPRDRKWYKIAGYILLFAAGSAAVQYVMTILDMWVNLRWNSWYTLILAILAHMLITVYILTRRHEVHELT